jgi:hypothetical protein
MRRCRSLAIALGALAINSGRLLRAIDAWIHPTPPSLIIVAPTTSEIV